MVKLQNSFLIQDQQLKERIWDIVLSTAEKFKDIDKIEQLMMENIDPDSRELYSNSLGSGYPGICLLLGELDRINPEGDWDLAALEYLKRIQNNLQTGSTNSLSLFNGLTGIMMGINACSRSGTRYQNFLTQLKEFFLEVYPTVLQDSFMRTKDGARMEDYDVISGWTGIGRSLLLFSNEPKMEIALKQILEYIVKLSGNKQINNFLIPSWYLSKDNLFLESDKKLHPNGIFNCGLSHGVSGILSFLSIASQHKITVSNHHEAIEKIATWLIGWIQEEKGVKFIPNVISLEDYLADSYTGGFQHRDAWCYGSPGVARVLWLAGETLNRNDLKLEALSLCKSTFQRSPETWRVYSSTFCHGYAGLLSLTQEMWRVSGDIDLEIHRNELVYKLLETFDTLAPLNFYDSEFNSNYKEIQNYTKVGLIEGTTGILLSLLSTINPNCTWESAFLIK